MSTGNLAKLSVDEVEELLKEYAEVNNKDDDDSVWSWWSEGYAISNAKAEHLRSRGIEYVSYYSLPVGPERNAAEKAFNKYWNALRKLKDKDFLPTVEGLGTVEKAESYGGEGQGDQYWFVLKITDGKTVRWFKINGWYASHDGGYYDGPFEEVKPVERVVTFYE